MKVNYAAHALPMQVTDHRFRLLPFVAAVVGIVLFVHLGNWQAAKAVDRAAEIAAFARRSHQPAQAISGMHADATDLQGAPVVVRGRFLTEQQFYVDNQQYQGQAGVHVVTPLLIQNSGVRVLVDRGWAPWGQSRTRVPEVPAPSGAVVVTGSATVPRAKKFFLMPDREDANPRLWRTIDLVRYAAIAGGPVQPWVILQNQDDAADTLVRQWPPPEDRVAMHRSYAWQWYGMAGALFLFFCATSWRKRTNA